MSVVNTIHVEVRRRLNANLIPLIDSWQDAHPGCLITRGYLCGGVASALVVTRQVVSRYIGEAVASGELLEITPMPDWRMNVPEGADLPDLYAVPVDTAERKPPAVYELQYGRPDSKGSGNVSFLITPKRLQGFLALVRENLRLPPPPDAVFYEPVIERMVRPATYQELKVALIASSPEKLTSSQAGDMLESVLKTLRLKAPTIE